MKKTKLPSLITVLVLSLITIVMWVSLDVYRAIKKPGEEVVPPSISQPISPTLDQDSINKIESRNLLDDSQVPDNIVNLSTGLNQQATPGPTQIPTIEPSPEPINASGSGTTP